MTIASPSLRRRWRRDGEESSYQYCSGDPVNGVDPDGEWIQAAIAIGFAVYDGYKAYKQAKRRGYKGWKMVGHIAKGVAIGAVTGLVGGAAMRIAGRVAGRVVGKMAAKAASRYGPRIGRYAAKSARRLWRPAKRALASGARRLGSRVRGAGCRAITKATRGAAKACFVAGTVVVAATGAVPIEAIEPGDLVLAQSDLTGEQTFKPVVRTFVKKTEELVHLKVADETITTTPEHPFWVEGEWVPAGELTPGTVVTLMDGSQFSILSVVREHLASPRDVYNFEVADFHTYFVASAGVWVHNACAAKFERHHAFPKFMGGPSKQRLVRMGTKQHRRFHADLNQFLDGHASRTVNGVKRTMRTKRGWSGSQMRSEFGGDATRKAMHAFYNGPGSKYKSAKKAFRKSLWKDQ